MLQINWTASPPGTLVQGVTADRDYHTQIVPVYTYVGGTTSAVVVKDCNTTLYTDATTLIGAQVVVSATYILDYSITNLTPDVASLAGNVLYPLQNGQAQVLVTASTGTRRYGAGMSTGVVSTHSTIDSFVPGSLARHVYDAIASAVAGQQPGPGTTELYSSANYDTAAPAATRNAYIFSGLLDLSGVSFTRTRRDPNVGPGELQQGFYFPGSLAADSLSSNRFCVTANHIGAQPGNAFVWMRRDGSMQAVSVLSAYSPPGTDFNIAFLSAPITGCKALKFLPDNWNTYLPVSTLAGGRVPALMKGVRLQNNGQDNRLRVTYLTNFGLSGLVGTYDGSGGSETGPVTPFTNVMSAFNGWNLPVLSGDSGSPTFLPINGEPVLVGQQYRTSSASCYLGLTAGIESWMTAQLGSAVTLSRADLSSFTAF